MEGPASAQGKRLRSWREGVLLSAWGRKRWWAGRWDARLGRSESPRAKRARGRCWRDSDSQTGMGACLMGRLTHRTLGRARARSAACASGPQLRYCRGSAQMLQTAKGELGSPTGEFRVPARSANVAAPMLDGPEWGYSFPLSFMR